MNVMGDPTKIEVIAKFSPKTEAERESLMLFLRKAPAVFEEYSITQEQTYEGNESFFFTETSICRKDDLRWKSTVFKSADGHTVCQK